jgi:mRNA interferase YafQ
MMQIVYRKKFLKDLELQKRRNKDMGKINSILYKLSNRIALEEKHRNHKLVGDYGDTYECHIEPDWLLIYCVAYGTIICERTGTHSDLF